MTTELEPGALEAAIEGLGWRDLPATVALAKTQSADPRTNQRWMDAINSISAYRRILSGFNEARDVVSRALSAPEPTIWQVLLNKGWTDAGGKENAESWAKDGKQIRALYAAPVSAPEAAHPGADVVIAYISPEELERLQQATTAGLYTLAPKSSWSAIQNPSFSIALCQPPRPTAPSIGDIGALVERLNTDADRLKLSKRGDLHAICGDVREAATALAAMSAKLADVERERDQFRKWAGHWQGIVDATCTVLGLGIIDPPGVVNTIRTKFESAEAANADLRRQADGPWCQPMENGEHQSRQYLVTYEDAVMGTAVFDDEAEARRYWEQANQNGWNCYLFGAMPLAARASGGSDA